MNLKVPFVDLAPLQAEIADELDVAWRDVVAGCAYIGGPFVERFERQWAAYCDTAYAVGVANGTDAIQLALRALGLGPGDEVVVPTNTFVATAEAVVAVGAEPRFADVDPNTLLLTSESLSTAIGPRTAAVVVVHLYGQPADMDTLCDVASRAGIAVVEDAAQAHGATWRGRKAGSFGQIGCFSFYPGKNLGAFGDAGAIVTDDHVLAERIRMLGNHGRSASSNSVHKVVGVNSRLDGLQAAVLSAKLPRLDGWTRDRRRVAESYRRELAGAPLAFVEEHQDACGVYHLMIARTPDRDNVRQWLGDQGIATGVHYPAPCHFQEAFRQFRKEPLPVAERAAREIISLPMFPHLTDSSIERVCQEIREFSRMLRPVRRRPTKEAEVVQ